jgi:hypothetical protein
LWVLTDAAALAEDRVAWSTVALLEETLLMVRERFDHRRPPEQ